MKKRTWQVIKYGPAPKAPNFEPIPRLSVIKITADAMDCGPQGMLFFVDRADGDPIIVRAFAHGAWDEAKLIEP